MRFGLAILVLLLAAAPSCGGDEGNSEVSTAEYRDLLAKAVADFGPRVDELEAFDETGAQAQEQGKRLLEALRRQAEVLGDVEPPADVRAAHDDFVQGLEELSDHIEAELDDMEATPELDADLVEDRLLREGDADAAIATIERAGRALIEAGYAENGG